MVFAWCSRSGSRTVVVVGRVLVVDDEPLVAKRVARALARHDVTVVHGARDALALLAAGRAFDVIVCDLVMPEITGMDLYAIIAETSPSQAAKMIFVSGGPDPHQPRLCAFYDAPPTLLIKKPFDTAALRAAVDERIP